MGVCKNEEVRYITASLKNVGGQFLRFAGINYEDGDGIAAELKLHNDAMTSCLLKHILSTLSAQEILTQHRHDALPTHFVLHLTSAYLKV